MTKVKCPRALLHSVRIIQVKNDNKRETQNYSLKIALINVSKARPLITFGKNYISLFMYHQIQPLLGLFFISNIFISHIPNFFYPYPSFSFPTSIHIFFLIFHFYFFYFCNFYIKIYFFINIHFFTIGLLSYSTFYLFLTFLSNHFLYHSLLFFLCFFIVCLFCLQLVCNLSTKFIRLSILFSFLSTDFNLFLIARKLSLYKIFSRIFPTIKIHPFSQTKSFSTFNIPNIL